MNDWIRKALIMTDIVGSTRLWQENPSTMAVAVARHDEIVESIIHAEGGRVIKSRGEGDSTFSVFDSASRAAIAAIALNRAVMNETWPGNRPIEVRASVHFGEVEDRNGDYYGPEVNLCARLRAVANPNQILISKALVDDSGTNLEIHDIRVTPVGIHRLKDLSEFVEIFDIQPKADFAYFPSLRTLNLSLGNLSSQSQSYFERTTDLNHLVELIKLHRLVSVVGTGGVGKSILAIEAARAMTPWMPDGVFAVEAESASSTDQLVATIATSLGLRPEASLSQETLISELENKKLLIVIDGSHVGREWIGGFVEFALDNCTDVKFLVTGRSSLRLGQEKVFRLGSLRVPGSGLDTEEIVRSEAVRFFVARAEMVRHDFVVTSKSARSIGNICVRMDGIPAALELAALKVRSLTPEQLDEHLSRRNLSFPGKGKSDPIHALFEWEWDSLSPVDKRIAWCVSAFENPFDLTSAESICEMFERSNPHGSPPADFSRVEIDPVQVVDAIDSLVENSLVIAESVSETMRYSMGSSFRTYVRARWKDGDAQNSLSRAHAQLFHERFRTAQSEGPMADSKDFLQAIEYFVAAQNLTSAIDLAIFMTPTWQSAGRYAEGLRIMKTCLEHCDPRSMQSKYGSLLNGIGLFEYHLGKTVEAESHLAAACDSAESLKDDALRSKALNNLALVSMAEGKLDEAIKYLETAIPYDREMGDESQLVISLSNLGFLRSAKGDLDVARRCLEEALELTSRRDDRLHAVPCLVNLGDLALEENDLESSANLSMRGLAFAEEVGDKVGSVCCMTNLGEVEIRSQRLEIAEPHLRRALSRSIDMGAHWLTASILDLLIIVFGRQNKREAATLATVYRLLVKTFPVASRCEREVDEITSQLKKLAGKEEIARLTYRAEKYGISGILDELPRLH